MTENTSVGIAIITWSRKFSHRGGIKSFFYQTFPVQVCAHIPLPLGTQFYFKMCALDVLRDDSSILEVTYGGEHLLCVLSYPPQCSPHISSILPTTDCTEDISQNGL